MSFDKLRGKTIANIVHDDVDLEESIRITFTDGTVCIINTNGGLNLDDESWTSIRCDIL